MGFKGVGRFTGCPSKSSVPRVQRKCAAVAPKVASSPHPLLPAPPAGFPLHPERGPLMPFAAYGNTLNSMTDMLKALAPAAKVV
jgi:hypothetical protein